MQLVTRASRRVSAWQLLGCVLGLLVLERGASAQSAAPPDESVLGELLITGDVQEHVTPLAVLPSLSPDLEDVIVRGVVRRDFELTGMFNVLSDAVVDSMNVRQS